MLKEHKKIVRIVLIAVFVIFALAIIYLNFIYTPRCQNYECWQKYMTKCKKVSFVNEQTEASWGYIIKGKKDNKCSIEVTLLLAKQGELRITNLVGKKMMCAYPLGITTYPEKDLSACTGLLKEELQTRSINKLHAYILENLGKVAEGLEQGV